MGGCTVRNIIMTFTLDASAADVVNVAHNRPWQKVIIMKFNYPRLVAVVLVSHNLHVLDDVRLAGWHLCVTRLKL